MCKMFERPDGNTRFNLPEAPPVSPECAHCGGKHRVSCWKNNFKISFSDNLRLPINR